MVSDIILAGESIEFWKIHPQFFTVGHRFQFKSGAKTNCWEFSNNNTGIASSNMSVARFTNQETSTVTSDAANADEGNAKAGTVQPVSKP